MGTSLEFMCNLVFGNVAVVTSIVAVVACPLCSDSLLISYLYLASAAVAGGRQQVSSLGL